MKTTSNELTYARILRTCTDYELSMLADNFAEDCERLGRWMREGELEWHGIPISERLEVTQQAAAIVAREISARTSMIATDK